MTLQPSPTPTPRRRSDPATLEIRRMPYMFRPVKRLVQGVALAILSVLLFAGAHCKLEPLPGFAFLACCPQGEGTPNPDSDCDTDGCALVESGLYKTEDNQVELTAAPLDLAGFVFLPESAKYLSTVTRPVRYEAVPPELTNTWQFSRRAAPAPRAPSLAS